MFGLFKKAAEPPKTRFEGRKATIGPVTGTERLRARIERVQASMRQVGDGARKDQLAVELKRLGKELRKAQAAAEIDKEE